MAKISFTKLGLKVNTDVKTIKCGDGEIEVLQYLPISDKYAIVLGTLQNANEDGIFNRFKMDVALHMNIIYSYTNITFTDKQKEDETALYDKLVSNGVVDEIVKAIPEEEYGYLCEMVETMAADQMEYGNTAGQVIKRTINDLPSKLQEAIDLLNNVDLSKYKDAAAFANAVGFNGGNNG